VRFDIAVNSPQNENGKTNLPLNLCQETEGHLTVDRGRYSDGIEIAEHGGPDRDSGSFTQGCFIPLRPLIEAKVLC